ncbi:MAG: hypothetical protein ACE5GI_01690 [Candidatus Aminicenantales bacterium]
MAVNYSVEIIRYLEKLFYSQKIHRPLRIQRYDPGSELTFNITGVLPAVPAEVKLRVEKFVGGGYAGQVYQVEVLNIKTPGKPIPGLEEGNFYALKILIPPTGLARCYRNLIYALAFQGPFSLQGNPAAIRAAALWQKIIRRAAGLHLGSERAVVDILATFADPVLGSCGEISEWVEGRLWRFEVDDNLDARLKWKVGEKEENVGSPEYRAKRDFMARLVKLMHEMGAAELARQYEWWTFKSQPNVLKRIDSDPYPDKGLVAVDFRAGLALLPFLPMCPADFKLIGQGIARGSLVQFDRGDINKLQTFIQENSQVFTGMEEALEELRQAEESYRSSLPDIAHHHLKLIYSRKLWSSIMNSNIKSWKIRNIIDKKTSDRLARNRVLALIFCCLGLIPFLGNFLRKIWGRADYRLHYKHMLSSLDYFLRAGRARIAESLIRWHRAGRVEARRAQKLASLFPAFLVHLPLSILPAKLHRFLTDRRFFVQTLSNIFVRPLRLYFKAEVREKWLLEVVSQGEKDGMLTKEEAVHIKSQIKEPFIQKYLKSLAVHICTLPVTQIVSVIVAFIYIRLHPQLSWAEASLHAGLILGFFQITPISPGSLVRGLYVTYLVLKERNLKDYNIAFYLSYLKYIDYLAFPIQMAYRYPELASFMAGHWATGAVHAVPVFGERGALLEHVVFDIFYNYPLTLRRRLRQRRLLRTGLKPRYWHLPFCFLGGLFLLGLMDIIYFYLTGNVPQFGNLWWLAVWSGVFVGAAASIWAGGALLSRRVVGGIASGALLGFFYTISNEALVNLLLPKGGEILLNIQLNGTLWLTSLWRAFIFSLAALIGVLRVETRPLRKKK